jgi:hypothetical protein
VGVVGVVVERDPQLLAVPCAVAAAHLVAVRADSAGPAFDQAAQQPLAGFGAAWGPLAGVAPGAVGGLDGASSRIAGTAIAIQSSQGRGICLLRLPGRGSATASVRLT